MVCLDKALFIELFSRLTYIITTEDKSINNIVRNILAVIAGILFGGAVNVGIIMIGGSIIPPPDGADMTTIEGMKVAMPLLTAKHFIMPFLAHALGSFVGALVAALIAARHKMSFALGIGAFTLLGGIAAASMIPAPTWFIVLDLVAAYIPTAFIAGKLASTKS